MCGRFTHLFTWKELHRLMRLSTFPDQELAPRYNVAPTQNAPVVLVDPERRRVGAAFRWGLIPFWSRDQAIGNRLINARSEGVEAKPSFREAVRRRRCLVPISGFYEWQKREASNRKQPYYIRPASGEVFCLAGLWESWNSPDARVFRSFTILTTTPNELMAPIHDRMPVILPESEHDLWLDRGITDPARVLPLLRPCPSGDMTCYPVSTRVNAPANDSPDCISPLAA